METVASYIVYATPVFFLLIGVELLVQRFGKRKLYRLNDTVTNINCGITQQVTNVFAKIFSYGLYFWVYQEFRFFDVPVNVWTVLILFLGIDFFYYWFHRLSHEINLIWASHVVHHQSEEYNLSVALRQSSTQTFFSAFFYVPLALVGFDPIVFLAVNEFQTLYQFWIHTKAIGKLPAPIEYVFCTPSHHRVHHGVDPKYIDKNHGGTLIIWDRMFGTFQEEEEEVHYGITSQLHSWNPFYANFQFYAYLWRTMRQARGIGDKLRVLFREPGWQPDYLGGPIKPKEVPADYHVYDPPVDRRLNYYVLFQFLVLLGGTSLFLFSSDALSWPLKLVNVVYIFAFSVTLGGILENKKWVFGAELFRILTLPLIVYLSFAGSAYAAVAGVSGLVLAAASLAWFVVSERRAALRLKAA